MAPQDTRGEPLRRISIEVSLHASGDVQVPANPYYALLMDKTNAVYEATLGGCEAPLAPTLLAPGETAHGWLSFDIPRKSEGLKLAYAPALAAAPREELVFELGP